MDCEFCSRAIHHQLNEVLSKVKGEHVLHSIIYLVDNDGNISCDVRAVDSDDARKLIRTAIEVLVQQLHRVGDLQ